MLMMTTLEHLPLDILRKIVTFCPGAYYQLAKCHARLFQKLGKDAALHRQLLPLSEFKWYLQQLLMRYLRLDTEHPTCFVSNTASFPNTWQIWVECSCDEHIKRVLAKEVTRRQVDTSLKPELVYIYKTFINQSIVDSRILRIGCFVTAF